MAIAKTTTLSFSETFTHFDVVFSLRETFEHLNEMFIVNFRRLLRTFPFSVFFSLSFCPFLPCDLNIFDDFTIPSKIYGLFACWNHIHVFDSKFHIRMRAWWTWSVVHAHMLTFQRVCSVWVCIVQIYTCARQMPYQFVQILNHGLFLFLTLNSAVR